MLENLSVGNLVIVMVKPMGLKKESSSGILMVAQKDFRQVDKMGYS